MYYLNEKEIVSWSAKDGLTYPSIIHTKCPHCDEDVDFKERKWNELPPVFRVAEEKCPACDGVVYFILVNHDGCERKLSMYASLHIHPTPSIRHPAVPLTTLGEACPETLRDYQEVLYYYNRDDWKGTVISARQLLERLSLQVLGADKTSHDGLCNALKAAIEFRGVDEAIEKLADDLSEGSSLASCMHMKEEPDARISRVVVEAVESYLDYLMVLPHKIQGLHKDIKKNTHFKAG